MSSSESQSCAHVLMIRPARFGANPQTWQSNRFQSDSVTAAHRDSQPAALVEFDGLVTALVGAGVSLHVFEDTPEPVTPDAVFPNNWVSFHADGSAVLYPMMAENRRWERRLDLLEALSVQRGFRIDRIVDLSHHERDGRFLEGTGSLVLDRINRIAYACVSPRTNVDVLGDFAQQLDYEVVAFEAFDPGGASIYHTNVMISIGTGFAVVCAASIREDERRAVVDSLHSGGRTVVELSFEQMASFAGNMLELQNERAERIVAMSCRALKCLTPQQRAAIEECAGDIISADISTIETLGGGSVRCMLAEVHLPRKR